MACRPIALCLAVRLSNRIPQVGLGTRPCRAGEMGLANTESVVVAERGAVPGPRAKVPGECPGCHRFVGPYGRCPYCGAVVGQRMAVRVFKVLSLLLAGVGLAILLLVARRSGPPAYEIGALGGTMNWAYIRVQGVASRQPAYDPDAESLRFWLSDGSGEIMVVAYRAQAREMLATGRLPVMGDSVTLEGTLRVREGFCYLVVDVPEAVHVQPLTPTDLAIGQVNAGLRYQKVRLQGVIRDDRTPYEGLRILTLRDATGKIDVIVPQERSTAGGPLPALHIGQSVQVVGAVDEYRGAPQVSVGRAGDVAILDEELAVAPARRIFDLTEADVGHMVLVEGRVTAVDPFSAGVKCALSDGEGTITLLLWQDFYDGLADASLLEEGATVRVQGEIAEYRGELELVPELPADVTVVGVADGSPPGADLGQGQLEIVPRVPPDVQVTRKASAATGTPASVAASTSQPTAATPIQPTTGPVATSTPAPDVRAIAAIAADDVGATLTVARAGIAGVDYFSKGIRYTLTDASGSIILLVWQDVLETAEVRFDLFPGSQVQVTGRIDQYLGDLEIVPQGGADLVLLARGERAPLEERSISAISPSDEGRVFAIHGTIARMEGDGWLRVWLKDGTGEMLVFLPARVVPYLPAGLGPGMRVRVTGEVDIYQGQLEIIPLAGADVEVQ